MRTLISIRLGTGLRRQSHLLLILLLVLVLVMLLQFNSLSLTRSNTDFTVKSYNSRPELSRKLNAVISDSSQVCQLLVRPTDDDIVYRNDAWQANVDGDAEIFAYSAFYDDRPIVGDLPYVRILVVSRRTPEQPYCHLWYDGHDRPYAAPVKKVVTGRGEHFPDSAKFDQLLFSCRLPTSLPIPTHVSVAAGRCRNSTILLPVHVDVRAEHEVEFGVCVAISYGRVPDEQFVEWIELNRLLGVGEFNVYNGTMSAEMAAVFDYYTAEGVLRVFQMPPPISRFSVKAAKLGSPASLNDCMMRNWYRYRYIVVIDFDEVIVPRRQQNYTAMLRAIDSARRLEHPWMSYTFRNVYYFDHLPQDESQPTYLRTMRFRHRVRPSGYLFTPKSFVNPRACLSVFNHYCYRRFPSLEHPWTIDVDADIAANNHYHRCGLGEAKCSPLRLNATVDNDILRFKPELDLRVRKALKDLNIY